MGQNINEHSLICRPPFFNKEFLKEKERLKMHTCMQQLTIEEVSMHRFFLGCKIHQQCTGATSLKTMFTDVCRWWKCWGGGVIPKLHGTTDMPVTCFIKLMDLPALPCTFNICEPHTNKNHSLNIPLSTHGVKLCGFTIEYRRTHLGLCSMMRTFFWWYTVKLFWKA